jgi:hypothetical protein
VGKATDLAVEHVNAAASASVQEESDSELRSARSPDCHVRSSSAKIRITRYRDLTQKTGC